MARLVTIAVVARVSGISLQQLADERNISLSALLRLITSEYVKRHHTT